MEELNKLENYLKEHDYLYERVDVNRNGVDRHVITVFAKYGRKERLWSAMYDKSLYTCQSGTLEVYGDDVAPHGKTIGWLTADDIIGRLGKVCESWGR